MASVHHGPIFATACGVAKNGTRRFPRATLADAAIRCDAWLPGAEPAEWFDGLITVLGPGGVTIEADRGLQLGSQVALCFALPDYGDEIVCSGVVRNAPKPGSVGVEFASITPAQKERIQNAVTRASTGRRLMSAPPRWSK